MNELAIAVLRLGLLLALWILIISIVLSQGRDLVVGRRNKTRFEQARRDAEVQAPVARVAAGPVPATAGASAAGSSPAAPSSSPCLLYTSPSPRDRTRSRMPSSA